MSESILEELKRNLSSYLIGYEEQINQLLAALLAGQNTVLIGPPGTAKSLMLRVLSKLVSAKYFLRQITAGTREEYIYGFPIINKLNEGIFSVNIDRRLPDCDIAILEELFTGPEELLSSMLYILSDKKFDAGDRTIDVPLYIVFATSNDEMEVDTDTKMAIRERFPITIDFGYVSDVSGVVRASIKHLKFYETKKLNPITDINAIKQLNKKAVDILIGNTELYAQIATRVWHVIQSNGLSLSLRVVARQMPLYMSAYSIVTNIQPSMALVKTVLPLFGKTKEERETISSKIVTQLIPQELKELEDVIDKINSEIKQYNYGTAYPLITKALEIISSIGQEWESYTQPLLTDLQKKKNKIEEIMSQFEV